VCLSVCCLHVYLCLLPAEITELVWTRLGARGCQLGIRRSEGPTVNFLGFKDKVSVACHAGQAAVQ
jgi:hypothetical protein